MEQANRVIRSTSRMSIDLEKLIEESESKNNQKPLYVAEEQRCELQKLIETQRIRI